jgi:hypothetical protein
VFSKHDDGDFSQSGESTVDSLASMQQSSAAHTMPADSRSPAGVGQTAPTSFGAGADLQPAGFVPLGDPTIAAAVTLPPGPQPSIPRHHQVLRPLSQTGAVLLGIPVCHRLMRRLLTMIRTKMLKLSLRLFHLSNVLCTAFFAGSRNVLGETVILLKLLTVSSLSHSCC